MQNKQVNRGSYLELPSGPIVKFRLNFKLSCTAGTSAGNKKGQEIQMEQEVRNVTVRLSKLIKVKIVHYNTRAYNTFYYDVFIAKGRICLDILRLGFL